MCCCPATRADRCTRASCRRWRLQGILNDRRLSLTAGAGLRQPCRRLALHCSPVPLASATVHTLRVPLCTTRHAGRLAGGRRRAKRGNAPSPASCWLAADPVWRATGRPSPCLPCSGNGRVGDEPVRAFSGASVCLPWRKMRVWPACCINLYARTTPLSVQMAEWYVHRNVCNTSRQTQSWKAKCGQPCCTA